jgi:hypothetical protein
MGHESPARVDRPDSVTPCVDRRETAIPRGSIRTVTVSQWVPVPGPVKVQNIVSEESIWNGQRWIDGKSDEATDIWREMFERWGEPWNRKRRVTESGDAN